ncbi:MAG TPA: class I SAM-dependent methyltransferase [Gemmataceae bacterium]|nr:class I SAM-dependent methyltransferase [Gemmataceae bacterium]
MSNKSCRGCGADRLALCVDLGEMPLAGGFLPNQAAIANEQKYPLVVHVCEDCGLIQIVDPVDPDILFQDYSFSSSTIGPLVAHFEQYAAWLHKRFTPRKVLEFGCNDGVLLAPLAKLGVNAVGIDISSNITEIARGKGLSVVTGFFDRESAKQIHSQYGGMDIVTGSNCFAHNADPGAILDAVRAVLNPKGHLCLEFMYAGDLLEQLQWDTLYHEHLTFYSLGTLSRLFGRHGFHVVHAERIPMHGGSLRIVAAQMPAAESEELKAIRAYEEKIGLNRAETWKDFGVNVQRKIDVVRETLGALGRNHRIWAYGAAGKATLWVNACKMDYLEAVVDASPLRANKLMPGTHTPIVFPDALRQQPPDYIFVSAWNYADVIRAKEKWFSGIWVTPLPELKFV